MITRLCLVLVGLGLVASQAQGQKPEAALAPTMVLRLRSIDGLIADVKYLAEAAGHAKEAGAFDDSIKQVLPNGFEGIDPKRPIGVYGILDRAGSLPDSTVVALVPISDEKAFLGLLQRLGMQTEKDGDVYSFTPPNSPVQVYFRFAHKYLYATIRDKKFIDLEKLPKPETVVPPDQADSIALAFRIDTIPNGIKQIALGQAELQASAVGEEKKEGESEAQRLGRIAGAKAASKYLARLLEECSELDLRFNVDRKAGALQAEFSLKGKPGSSLATDIAKLGAEQSAFAALDRPDGAVTLLMHATQSAEIRDVIVKGFEEGYRKAIPEQADEKTRALSEKLFKAIEPTLKAGVFSFGVSVRGPSAKEHLTFVAGLQLKEGKQLEALLHEALKEAPAEQRNKIKIAAHTINGVAVHQFDTGAEPEAEKVLGSTLIYLAIRDDAVLLAGGEEGLAALKEALEASPAKAPPLKFEVALARLAPFMKASDKNNPAAAARQAFPKGSDGNDKIRLIMDGGSKFSLRLEAQVAVLRFLGALDQQKKAE